MLVSLEIEFERVHHARFNLNTARSEFLEAMKSLCRQALETGVAVGTTHLKVQPTHDGAVMVEINQGEKNLELRYADGAFDFVPLELDRI